jgi:hypothetical protein
VAGDRKGVRKGGEVGVKSPNVPYQAKRIWRRENTMGDRDLMGERGWDNLQKVVDHWVLISHLWEDLEWSGNEDGTSRQEGGVLLEGTAGGEEKKDESRWKGSNNQGKGKMKWVRRELRNSPGYGR